mmetsp:Transcript_27535/g.38845  ORF Transcript_27535/g.38845 Transcript_27535/m.38845 type:complete len:309 (+) Transcript_27535:2743-3669(+)
MSAKQQCLVQLSKETWLPLEINDTTLYFKANFNEQAQQYALLITDLIHVWWKVGNSTTFDEEKKEYNPQLETTNSRLLTILHRLFVDRSKSPTKFEFYVNGDGTFCLSVCTKISSYLFAWKFLCQPLGEYEEQAQYLKEHLVLKLFSVVAELSRQNQALLSLLKNNKEKKPKQFDEISFFQQSVSSKDFLEECKNPVLKIEGTTKLIFQQVLDSETRTSNSSNSYDLVSEKESQYSIPFDQKLLDESPQSLQPSFVNKANDNQTEYIAAFEESEEELKRRQQIESKRKLQDTKKSKKKIDPKKIKLLL